MPCLFWCVCAGTIERATDAKVAVYSCPFDSMATETKGTVLLKTASELKSFSKGDEDLIEGVGGYGVCVCVLPSLPISFLQQVRVLSELGVTVVVSGGKIGEMALHFLNQYKIMAVR